MPKELHPFISNKWQSNLPVQGNEWFINDRCFGYIPRADIESIFMGSFPAYEVVNFSRRRGNKEFFYGSSDNNLWHILSALTELPTATEQNCFSLLNQPNFGITDILKEVNRNGTNSSDKDLIAFQYNDIIHLLQKFPKIKTIFVTSGGKSPIRNSTSNCVSKWFRDYLLQSGYTCKGFNTNGYSKQIIISQNNVQIIKINLIALITPSDLAYQSLQACINRNNLTDLFNLIPNNLLAPIANSSFNKLRLIQWGYHLSNCNFNIPVTLQDVITDNQPFLQNLFR